MKPPFVKLRIGELYGSENNEILGFIKTTSYSIPAESPWETKEGKRRWCMDNICQRNKRCCDFSRRPCWILHWKHCVVAGLSVRGRRGVHVRV